MPMSMLGSAASGLISAASFTAVAVLTGTAAVAGAAGNAVIGVVSDSGNIAAKGSAAAGPAAGSYATAWMSSLAGANGACAAFGTPPQCIRDPNAQTPSAVTFRGDGVWLAPPPPTIREGCSGLAVEHGN
ncbi:hypothetical protein KC19_4G085900 [Ceratodon purpureus]|uniref:Uncharacterized protein n=1 Tax=Ceratodon purpureus TaxID=3225 RepID=A0A8T0I852_CERPU|nr:hypothetical protein KC19_4G085900 [Ceratodon purpureus]